MRSPKFARLIKRINWYPPFLGMGIHVKPPNKDLTRFEVQLKPKWYTRNLFGTHFGGSLYAMSDPFFVFIVTMNLGSDYIVWDKSAEIDFIRPAKGIISGVFEISSTRLDEIRKQVDEQGKNTYHFTVDLIDEEQQVVAKVIKEVYVRKKRRQKPHKNTL